MQENISLDGDKIKGKSKYVKGYAGFSSKEAEQEGNYLAIKVDDNTTTFELSDPKSKGSGTIDDGFLVVRITDKTQTITLKAKDKNTRVLTLTDLELEEESA